MIMQPLTGTGSSPSGTSDSLDSREPIESPSLSGHTWKTCDKHIDNDVYRDTV